MLLGRCCVWPGDLTPRPPIPGREGGARTRTGLCADYGLQVDPRPLSHGEKIDTMGFFITRRLSARALVSVGIVLTTSIFTVGGDINTFAQNTRSDHTNTISEELPDILETSVRYILQRHQSQMSNMVVYVASGKNIILKQPKQFSARFKESPPLRLYASAPHTDPSGYYRDSTSGKAVLVLRFYRIQYLRDKTVQVEYTSDSGIRRGRTEKVTLTNQNHWHVTSAKVLNRH